MNLSLLSQNEMMTRCAWCYRVLDPKAECFGAGAQVRPETRELIAAHEGKFLVMPFSSGREVIVVVPTSDSQARKDGNDFYFQTCSEECCLEISNAIKIELLRQN